MSLKAAKAGLLASAVGLSLAVPPGAHADVIYEVFNPSNPPFPFVLFVYDSPGFITTDTTVSAAQLAFINPLNLITSVDFIPDSTSMPGDAELDVFETNTPTEQVRYYPSGTFDEVGVTAGLSGSAGYPNSMLSVAIPEPSSIALFGFGAGALGLLALRRRVWKMLGGTATSAVRCGRLAVGSI